MGRIPTVRVKHGDGFMIINESDFDAERHEPFDELAEKRSQNGEKQPNDPPQGNDAGGGSEGGDGGEKGDSDAPDGVIDLGRGWYHARVNGQLIPKANGEPAKFRGEVAARAAIDAARAG